MHFTSLFSIFFSLWILAVSVAAPVHPLPEKLFRLGGTAKPVNNIRAKDFGDPVNGFIVPPKNGRSGLSTFASLDYLAMATGKNINDLKGKGKDAKAVWTIETALVQKAGFIVTADGGIGRVSRGHVSLSVAERIDPDNLLINLNNMGWKNHNDENKRPKSLNLDEAHQANAALHEPKASRAGSGRARREVLRSIN